MKNKGIRIPFQPPKRQLTADWTLLPHQEEFIFDQTPSVGLVAGYGSGKSFAGGCKAVMSAINHAGFEGIAVAPTAEMATAITKPNIIAALERTNIAWDWRGGERKFLLDVPCANSKPTTIYIRSAENYERLFGLNLAWVWADEVDLMKRDVAEQAIRAFMSRLRSGNPEHPMQFFCTSTPEGWGWMYHYFVDDLIKKPELAAERRLIRAKTTDNGFLPESYLDKLRAAYPPNLLKAYLNGEFTNLAEGSVYADYNAELNDTPLTFDEARSKFGVKHFHLGADFNVKSPIHPFGITGVLGVQIGDILHIVAEVTAGHNTTRDFTADVRQRFGNAAIYVYPDASSGANKTNASDSDREQLRQAGFVDRSPKGNPRVEDRVNAVNARILSADGQRRLLVNRRTCPNLVKALTTQAYSNGAPEKNVDGSDDLNDALGYLVHTLYPLTSAKGLATVSWL